MPSLEGDIEWINAFVTPNDLLGHPTIVQFWAISCPVCKLNIPRLQQFLEDYDKQGLWLVSIHMPRMEADTDTRKVVDAMQQIHLSGPCAIDNQHILGERFHTKGVWPVYYLFDSEMRLRSRAAGMIGIRMAENSLRRLLALEKQ